MLCPHCGSARVIKKGIYKSNGKNSEKRAQQRYFCKNCSRYVGSGCFGTLRRQKRPELLRPILSLLVSGVSQRRTALLMGTTRQTVERKLLLLSRLAELYHGSKLAQCTPKASVTFDEMETFEHSKCKPVAIAVAVDTITRHIIAAKVARMPAKGRLAAISRKRYGYRRDERPAALRKTLRTIKAVSVENVLLRSDESPRYPKYIREILPKAYHKTYKGRRGCVVGQGELKAGGFDPLFALNHSCAMFRDNLKRLSRRTWCTTKRPDRLQALINLYVVAHNSMIDGRVKNLSRLLINSAKRALNSPAQFLPAQSRVQKRGPV